MSVYLSKRKVERPVHGHVTHARYAGGGLETPLARVVCGENEHLALENVPRDVPPQPFPGCILFGVP